MRYKACTLYYNDDGRRSRATAPTRDMVSIRDSKRWTNVSLLAKGRREKGAGGYISYTKEQGNRETWTALFDFWLRLPRWHLPQCSLI